jgi:hypothetical protein
VNWRPHLSEWFAAYSLVTAIVAVIAKMAVILRSLS